MSAGEPAPAGQAAAGELASVPLPPEREREAIVLLRAAGEADPDRLLTELRADPAATLYAIVKHDAVVALYGLRKVGLTLELRPLAATTAWEEWLALKDAVARAGKFPVVVEADEAGAKTYRQMGFRLVGKRRAPDGTTRYRLGWHTPTRQHPR